MSSSTHRASARFPRNTQLWIWGAIVLSVLVCGFISWIHFHQRQVLGQAITAMELINQARLDLAKGFLYASMGREPSSPFNRDQGFALLEQAVGAFDQALDWEAQQGSGLTASTPQETQSSDAFRKSVQVFRDHLQQWSADAARQPARETDLRIAFFELERQAERADTMILRDMRRFSSSLDFLFALTVWGAAFLLTWICVAVFLAARDQRTSEIALRESETRFRALMETSPIAITATNRQGTVIFANAAAESVLGVSRDEATGLAYNAPHWRISDHNGGPVPDEDLPFQRVLSTSQAVYGMRHTLERPDGQRVLLSINAAPLFSETGEFDGMVAAVDDITDRKRAEEALAQSEARLRALIEAAPYGAHEYELQPDGRLIFAGYNPAANRILATDHSSYLGKTIEEAFPPLSRTDIPETYRNVAAKGVRYEQEQVVYGHGDISGAYDVSAFQTGPNRMAVLFRDVTERKRAEEALHRRAGELDALNALARDVSLSLSLDEVVAAAVQGLLNAVATDLTFLFVREGDRLLLKGVAPGNGRERLAGHPEHRVGECLCGLAVRQRQPLYSRDIFADTRCTWDECKKAGLRSFAALPLRAGNDVIGVVGLASFTERDFASQAPFLETLASSVAVGLQNAILFAATRKAEEDLRQSREQLARIVETTPNGILIADRDGRFTFANPTAEAILGLTRNDITARMYDDHAWRITTVDGRPVPTDQLPISRVMSSEETVYGVEHAIEHPDGRRVVLSINAAPLRDAAGGLTGTAVALTDITERKRAEEALRDSEATLRNIFLAAPIGIGMVADRVFIRANDRLCAMTGYSRQELHGQSLRLLYPTDEDFEFVATEERKQIVERGTGTVETRWKRKDGSIIDVLLSSTPLDASNGSTGVTLTALDITERRQFLEKLEQMNAFLEQRVKERTAVAEDRAAQLRVLASRLTTAEQHERRRVAHILHEHFQQLLVGAKFGISELRQKMKDESLAPLLQQIDSVIDESITASRTLTVELCPPVLYDLGLASALEWLGRWMEERYRLSVAVQADHDADPEAEDVGVLLFHATRELLFNIVKHAHINRAALRMSRRDGHDVEIVVADEGGGFDMLSLSTSHSTAGGFGLFGIRERVELVGGRMDLESRVGHGTQVRLVVPIASKGAPDDWIP